MYLRKKPKLIHLTLLSFSLLVLLPTIIIVYFLFSRIQVDMIRQSTMIETDSLSQMAYTLSAEIKNKTIMASSIIHNKELIALAPELKKAQTKSEKYQVTRKIDTIIDSYFINNTFKGEIYLVFDNGDFYLSRNVTCLTPTYETLKKITEESDPLSGNTQIAEKLYTKQGESEPYSMALVTYPPPYWGDKKSYQMEVLISPLESIRNLYHKGSQESEKILLIVNKYGTVISSNNKDLINDAYVDIAEASQEKIIISKGIENTNWKIVKIIDPHVITKNVEKLFFIVSLSFLIMLFLYFLYNILTMILIHHPLQQLINNMSKVGKGKYQKETFHTYIYELEEMGDSFNVMVEELDALNREIEEAHRETMLREIEALRFQINPHFMCNSLGSIRMMAMIAHNDAIKRMSTALMVIMEDNLNGTGSFASMKHELKNIESYIYIMQVRYGNSFTFEKVVDDCCLTCKIPSMLLQPLIENSILHGLRGIEREGLITLSIKKEESCISLTIWDNGKGVSEARRASLFDENFTHNKGLNHIGLWNVKRRLELLYPKKGTLTIQSSNEKSSSYFEVTIGIPYEEMQENSRPCAHTCGVER